MTKSKSGNVARLPKDQRCKFIIGPVNSWFMPNTTDIWTQPREVKIDHDGHDMDCDDNGTSKEAVHSSYFIHGSVGCFCYGQVHHYNKHEDSDLHQVPIQTTRSSPISAVINLLIDVKEDNSRVSCVRYLKNSIYPLVAILTESGSFLIHDCSTSENVIHYKKLELLNKLGIQVHANSTSEHNNKRPKFNIAQQINSCLWPEVKNVFLGISLLKEETNFVLWLRLKDVVQARNGKSSISKNEFIESYEKLELKLPSAPLPICCMESAMLDNRTCLIAVAMEDGLINILIVDLLRVEATKTIRLARHSYRICSMSFLVDNPKKFPQGLLASASRDGKVFLWDIDNQYCFGDYLHISNGDYKVDWFALKFIPMIDVKTSYLVVSNPKSGLTLLEVPKNVRSSVRLKEVKDAKVKNHNMAEQAQLKHHALLFDIAYDSLTGTIMTSSLDNDRIFWKCYRREDPKDKGSHIVEIKPHYLYPSMPRDSRTHMLRHSFINNDMMVVAMGKAGIRFYKIPENPAQQRFDQNASCSLISSKIKKAKLSPTSVAWNPSQEYRLAIGTLEGKVLRADITPRRGALVEGEHKPLIRSRLGGETQADHDDIFEVEYKPIEREEANVLDDRTDGVYSLCWGPDPTSPQDLTKLAIYAIGSVSHRLFIYYSKKENSDKMTNYLDERLDQSLPEAIGEASEVSWKSSLDLMALGTTTGKIIIACYQEKSPDQMNQKMFIKLTVIQGPLGTTYIQCLSWHPTTDRDCPHYHCLAASANESAAYVFNLGENILVEDVKKRLNIDDQSLELDNQTTLVTSAYSHKLDVHTKPISDINWNPHDPMELATCSFDRTCCVWRLNGSDNSSSQESNNARVQSKFSARDRLFTLDWSLVSQDLIFTSGHDSTIWAWRPSENLVATRTSELA